MRRPDCFERIAFLPALPGIAGIRCLVSKGGFDPTPYMRGDTVELLINVDNPRQYVMDIEFLLKAG